jgi:hypothetical protein
MFRHLVVTGRSRLALYLARIPAGLAIVVPLVAIGYTIICVVCVFAAPTFIDDWNVNIPAGLSRAGFENWSGEHAVPVICISITGTFRVLSRASARLAGRSPQSPLASPRLPKSRRWPSESRSRTTPDTPALPAVRRPP